MCNLSSIWSTSINTDDSYASTFNELLNIDVLSILILIDEC